MSRVSKLLAVAGALLPIALVAATAEAEQDGVKLRYKFEKGDKRIYEMKQDTIMVLPVLGMDGMEMTNLVTARQRQTVAGVSADGKGEIDSVYEKMTVSGKGAAGETSWDSEDGSEPPDPTTAMFAGMLGKTIKMTMAPTGEIEKVDVAEIAKAMREANPMMTAMGVDIDALAEQQVTTGSVKFPDRELAVGDSFDHEATQDAPPLGSVNIKMKYTLKAIEDRGGRQTAVFAVTGDLEVQGGGGGMMMLPGAKAEMSDSEFSGGLVFDVDRGIVVEMSVKQRIEMTMKTDQGGGNVIESKVKLSQSVTQKLVEAGGERPTTPGGESKTPF